MAKSSRLFSFAKLKDDSTAADHAARLLELEAALYSTNARIETISSERKEAIIAGDDAALQKLAQESGETEENRKNLEAAIAIVRERLGTAEHDEAIASLTERSTGFPKVKRDHKEAWAKVQRLVVDKKDAINKMLADVANEAARRDDEIAEAIVQMRTMEAAVYGINEDAAHFNRPDLSVPVLPLAHIENIEGDWEQHFRNDNEASRQAA